MINGEMTSPAPVLNRDPYAGTASVEKRSALLLCESRLRRPHFFAVLHKMRKIGKPLKTEC